MIELGNIYCYVSVNSLRYLEGVPAMFLAMLKLSLCLGFVCICCMFRKD